MALGNDAELSFGDELPLTQAATRFARRRHAGQRRAGDRAPFVIHPLEVAALLERAGCSDAVVAAGVVHDVLEDTETVYAELASEVGREVADLVVVVSDAPGIEDEEERKRDVRERVRRHGGAALLIYAADKVSKVRELRTAAALATGDEDVPVKLARHRASLAMLELEIPEHHLVELLRSEIRALEQVPLSRAQQHG